MRILAVESSCDDLSWAIVDDGKDVIACHVASQTELHNKTGGVVPEVAAREHLTMVLPVLEAITREVPLESIDAIACTAGPGLLGSLLVGIVSAQTLSVAVNKPLIPVHHIEGHVAANWLERDQDTIHFPAVVLTVSGGHNDLYLMRGFGQYEHIGTTKDDAAGEAFDKVARMLGLGYPGGPAIDRYVQASGITVDTNPLPRAWGEKGSLHFSFSGLKSEVRRRVMGIELMESNKQAIAFAFQESVVDVLSRKTLDAFHAYRAKSILVTGGVSASSRLKEVMLQRAEMEGTDPRQVMFPVKKMYSTDNAAMIACAAYHVSQVNPTRIRYSEADKLTLAPFLTYVLASDEAASV